MVKKLKVDADEEQHSLFVVDSARRIWLAGLGAFARAETESSKLFEYLVKEGEQFEQHTRKVAGEKIDEVKDRVDAARNKASVGLEKLEDLFEERLTRVLNGLGVPTNRDIEDLSKRVDALQESIKALHKS